MAAPATPSNFLVQSGDAKAYLSWNQDTSEATTSYLVQRSLDGITYTLLTTITGSPLANYYFDASGTAGTTYYYQVAGENGSGTSPYTAPQSVVILNIGIQSLGALRVLTQQRCDKVNSQFITTTEWNSYISDSYKELYDLLIQKYADDYYVANTYSWTTDGASVLFPLPPDFYKNLLVEVALNPSDNNSWITLRKFQRIQQNLWNYPNIYTFYGITNLRYRIDGNYLHIVPICTAGQTLRMWYCPRPSTLLADFNVLDGVSGWYEYIVIDACIKAMIKEESLEMAAAFGQQKAAIIARIEAAAENRDTQSPEVVSDSRMRNFAWTDDGSFGGNGAGSMW